MTFTPDDTTGLTASSIATIWQDTNIRYRMGPFYAGILIGNLTMVVDKQGTTTLDLYGNGTGGNLGVSMQLGKGGSFNMSYSTLTISTVKEVSSTAVTLGPRADLELSAGFKITKWLQIMAGYRNRTYSVTTTAQFDETVQTTFFALKAATIF
jgi:hypothetical protein